MATAAPPTASQVPRTRGRATLRYGRRLAFDPLPTFDELQERFGDAVCVPSPGARVYLLYHPDDVEHVLMKLGKVTKKGRAIRRTKRLLGNGLLNADGDEHMRHRKLAQPAFQPRHLTPYAEVMVRRTEELTAGWQDGTQLDGDEAMARLTLLIAGDTMFGVDLTSQVEEIGAALAETRSQFALSLHPLAPIVERMPFVPRIRRFDQAKRVIVGVVRDAIADRQRAIEDGTAANRGDLLSLLLTAFEEDGSYSERQLIDEALTLLLAGHETTASALGFTLHLLAAHPNERERVEQELEAVLGDRTPTYDDVEQLVVTRAVFCESLRLFPPGPAFARTMLEPATLPSGVKVRANDELIFPLWTIHHDSRWWDAPLEFRPDRFLAQAEDGSLRLVREITPRGSYAPFGMGRRVCIGQGFATMEATLVLATLLRSWRLDHRKPGFAVETDASFTVRPKELPLVAHRRGDD